MATPTPTTTATQTTVVGVGERRRRRWLAYLLTVFVPGLGHASVGHWKRAGAWFGLYVLAIAFLSARSLSAAFDPGSPFFVTALQFESVSFVDVAAPLAVLVACLLDLWLRFVALEDGEPGA